MSNDWITRQTLLERAKSGDDEAAWEEFAGYYNNFIDIILAKMMVNKDERDDLKQEILLLIWRDLKKMEAGKNGARFRTWLSTVIRNRINNHFRARNSRLKREDKHAVREEASQNDVEKLIDAEWKSHMVSLVMEHIKQFFSGNAIDVFMMTLENKGIDEIALKLDLSKDTVYVLRNRVKQRFKKEMHELLRILEF